MKRTSTNMVGLGKWLSAATLLATALTGCVEEKAPVVQDRLVKVVKVGNGSTDQGRQYSGEVRARYETLLGFRVGGKIAERLVDAGAVVKAGQVLARLDGTDAGLQAIQADAQSKLAEAEVKRYRELREKNFISQSALDSKETLYKAAAAQAGLARNQSAYTSLVADKDGVIAAVLAEAGQVVAAGQGVMRLARKGDREVAINIPEEDVAGIKPGMTVDVILWADGNRVIAGKIRELAPAADPATRTYPARISLPAEEASLPLGLSATVRVSKGNGRNGDSGEFHTIPLTAIFQQGDKPAVWKVSGDGKLLLQPVTVVRYGETEALVKEGLAADDVVVAAGVHKLHAGEQVRFAGMKATGNSGK